MKTLLVLRHAKSSWKNQKLDDFDRPLAPRGRKDAAMMGGHMASTGKIPQTVLCSPAKRAQSTWRRIEKHIGREIPTTLVETLYLARPDRILEIVGTVEPQIDCALIVGHNPGLGKFLRVIGDAGPPGAADLLPGNFPTCALAEIQFDGADWRELADCDPRIVSVVCPADLSLKEGSSA